MIVYIYNLDHNQCTPREEIDIILGNLLMNSFFSDSYVDSDDYVKSK